MQLIGEQVYGLKRCPQCLVANPLLKRKGPFIHHTTIKDYNPKAFYYLMCQCSYCKRASLFYGHCSSRGNDDKVEPNQLYILGVMPEIERVDECIPQMAARYLQQAIESKHAPDGVLMLTASSIDAMLKDKGYTEGSLYKRIESASRDGVLTQEMSSWAHEIRLGSNEPRHADENFTGASAEDAEQIIEFAKALGEYLYVLPSRVRRWQARTSIPSTSADT